MHQGRVALGERLQTFAKLVFRFLGHGVARAGSWRIVAKLFSSFETAFRSVRQRIKMAAKSIDAFLLADSTLFNAELDMIVVEFNAV